MFEAALWTVYRHWKWLVFLWRVLFGSGSRLQCRGIDLKIVGSHWGNPNNLKSRDSYCESYTIITTVQEKSFQISTTLWIFRADLYLLLKVFKWSIDILMDWLIKEDKYRIQSTFSFLVKHSNSYSLEHHIVANRYTWPLERIINFLAPSCFTMTNHSDKRYNYRRCIWFEDLEWVPLSYQNSVGRCKGKNTRY